MKVTYTHAHLLGVFTSSGASSARLQEKSGRRADFGPFFLKEELRRRIKTVSFPGWNSFFALPSCFKFWRVLFFFGGERGEGSQKQLNNVFVCDKTAGWLSVSLINDTTTCIMLIRDALPSLFKLLLIFIIIHFFLQSTSNWNKDGTS